MVATELPPETSQTMARRIELWPVDKLVPYARNARTHSDAQVAQIAASIAQFGFNNPILVDTNAGIIAGHGRLLAARKLRLDHVPVVVLDHLTETQKRAYILADNKLAEQAGWDDDLLRGELADLKDADLNLEVLGFSEDELRTLLAEAEPAPAGTPEEEEEIPEAPVDPVTRPGDIWLIGKHRLICGDCRDRATVAQLLNGSSANVVITSPPYASQRAYDPASGFRPVSPEEYVPWFRDVAANIVPILAPDGSYFLNIKEHADEGAEPVRKGPGRRPSPPVGMAVRGRTLLAQDRRWRAGRLGQSLQERVGAGLSLLPQRKDQVPAEGGRALVG